MADRLYALLYTTTEADEWHQILGNLVWLGDPRAGELLRSFWDAPGQTGPWSRGALVSALAQVGTEADLSDLAALTLRLATAAAEAHPDSSPWSKDPDDINSWRLYTNARGRVHPGLLRLCCRLGGASPGAVAGVARGPSGDPAARAW